MVERLRDIDIALRGVSALQDRYQVLAHNSRGGGAARREEMGALRALEQGLEERRFGLWGQLREERVPDDGAPRAWLSADFSGGNGRGPYEFPEGMLPAGRLIISECQRGLILHGLQDGAQPEPGAATRCGLRLAPCAGVNSAKLASEWKEVGDETILHGIRVCKNCLRASEVLENVEEEGLEEDGREIASSR